MQARQLRIELRRGCPGWLHCVRVLDECEGVVAALPAGSPQDSRRCQSVMVSVRAVAVTSGVALCSCWSYWRSEDDGFSTEEAVSAVFGSCRGRRAASVATMTTVSMARQSPEPRQRMKSAFTVLASLLACVHREEQSFASPDHSRQDVSFQLVSPTITRPAANGQVGVRSGSSCAEMRTSLGLSWVALALRAHTMHAMIFCQVDRYL